jgi:hypothetical protein
MRLRGLLHSPTNGDEFPYPPMGQPGGVDEPVTPYPASARAGARKSSDRCQDRWSAWGRGWPVCGPTMEVSTTEPTRASAVALRPNQWLDTAIMWSGVRLMTLRSKSLWCQNQSAAASLRDQRLL